MDDDRKRLEALASAGFPDHNCPAAEQLAAFTLNMLSGTEQLRLAAHIRTCPLCRLTVDLCRPPTPNQPLRTRVAQRQLLPLAASQRSSGQWAAIRHYVSADLTIELTIAPPDGDDWRMTGLVMRGESPLGNAQIQLRAGRRRYEQHTDTQGFFTFEALPAGRYTLSVIDAPIRVQIRALDLHLDDQA